MLETVRDFEVVGEVERADDVLAAIASKKPDVLILDVELPGASGISAIEPIRGAAPAVRVLMLSGFSDPHRIRAALRAGASGYILKNASGPEVLEAIRTVASGKIALGSGVAEAFAEALRDEPEEERVRRLLAQLSERELQVLRLAASGESNLEIGKRLFISEGTVKNHMTHILRKLGVADRTQAAILAVKHGLGA